jgi:hypothetical protein
MSTRLAYLAFAGACDSGGGFIDASDPNGAFAVRWGLQDTNQRPIQCDEVGAVTMRVAAQSRIGASSDVELFRCSQTSATSQGVPAGRYDADFELDDVSGKIASSPSQLAIDIHAGQTTQLQPLTFSIDATGTLSLSIASGQPGGNCGATAMNGAGITGTTIVLRHVSGSCAPTEFAYPADSMLEAGNYELSDCQRPPAAPCIEADQPLTVSGVASGRYTIDVRGMIGSVDCWSLTSQLVVPPLGRTLTQTLMLAYATGTPGC